MNESLTEKIKQVFEKYYKPLSKEIRQIENTDEETWTIGTLSKSLILQGKAEVLSQLEGDVLKILSGYTVIEKQKIRELADLLNSFPKMVKDPTSNEQDAITWHWNFHNKFVEVFGVDVMKSTKKETTK